MRRLHLFLFAVLALATQRSFAQTCGPAWHSGLFTHNGPGVDGWILTTTLYDDGNGLKVFAGGQYNTIGGISANGAAVWDGRSWQALGEGVDRQIRASIVFDDGSGPALYIGGDFSMAGGLSVRGIARWDGSTWSRLPGGTNGIIEALAVYDDGGGPALFVGGDFTRAGGNPADSFAKWDGTSWTEVGGGVDRDIQTFLVHDDGSGSELFVSGFIREVGGKLAARGVAKWNGQRWDALEEGFPNIVYAMAEFDDGLGSKLYVGGRIRTISTWDGVQWSELPDAVSFTVEGFTTLELNGETSLFMNGLFTSVGQTPARNIARYDGANWHPLAAGLSSRHTTLLLFDSGNGPTIHASGTFTTAGTETVNGLAQWDGSDWFGYGDSAVGNGMNGAVLAQTLFDDGSGEALYVGGSFLNAGPVTADHIARWNGSEWSALREGLDGTVLAMAVYDDGSGPALYAGGSFRFAGDVPANRVAKWDGVSWSPLGSGIGGASSAVVYALAGFDDGGGAALYAGGRFEEAGGKAAAAFAKWNGEQWTGIEGLEWRTGAGWVSALCVFDDGSGEELFVGGVFDEIDYLPVGYIAKWDGTTWHALGEGVGGLRGNFPWVISLTIFDDGGGAKLIVGGDLDLAGGKPANRIASWDGNSWAALGEGLRSSSINDFARARTLTALDDGNGPALFAGGLFDLAGDIEAGNLARWDGQSWTAMDGGVDATVYSSASFDDGSGPALFVGGSFISAGQHASSNLAKWGCPFSIGDVDCDGNLNAFDIEPFLVALFEPEEYPNRYPNCHITLADINRDGTIDAFDIEAFLDLLFP